MTMIAIDYIWLHNKDINIKTNFMSTNLKKYADMDSYMGDIPRLINEKDFDKFPKDIIYYDNNKLVLLPVKLYKNPFLLNRYIILSELYNTDDSPHESNHRFLLRKNKPCKTINITQTIKFSKGNNIEENYQVYKNIIEDFIKICLDMSIKISNLYPLNNNNTWNLEFNNNSVTTNIDDLVISIYILKTFSEKNNIKVFFENNTISVLDDNIQKNMDYGDYYSIYNIL